MLGHTTNSRYGSDQLETPMEGTTCSFSQNPPNANQHVSSQRTKASHALIVDSCFAPINKNQPWDGKSQCFWCCWGLSKHAISLVADWLMGEECSISWLSYCMSGCLVVVHLLMWPFLILLDASRAQIRQSKQRLQHGWILLSVVGQAIINRGAAMAGSHWLL